MANPVERLLNVVDDHKRDMPDNAYKGIMDELAEIKKIVETKARSRYKVFFIVLNIKRQEHDDAMVEVGRHHHEVEVYLSEDEVKYINKNLDNDGAISEIEYKYVQEQLGLHQIDKVREILRKQWESVIVEIDTNYKDSDADDGVEIRVIAGNYRGYKGPVDGIESNPSYLDIIMPPNIERIFPFETSNQGFARG